MYSLYRAWFGEENYSHLETLSPPDTVIRVGNDGEHQFVAHRGVLAAHSGYLKALLSTTSSSASRVTGDSPNPITSISVSSVGGEAFAPLLNYMYTGRLEVTLDNIYSVLLATHLLHMPGALEQCRAALLRLRGPAPPPPLPQTSTPTILRPVANRLVGPSVCWPQSSLYSSAGFPLLPSLQLPPRIPVIQSPQETSTAFRVNSPEPSSSTFTPERSQKYRERSNSPINIVSTSKLKDSKLRGSKVEEKNSNKKEQDDFTSQRTVNSSPSTSEKISVINIDNLTQHKSGRSSRSSNDLATTSSSGVVLDIACCDGPVKFHRVLNENYTKPDNGLSNNQIDNSGNNNNSARQRVSQPASANSSAESEIIGENDENGRPNRQRSEFDESSVESSETGGNYTCEYCRHTFKSHYCYKKHARRHLLPTGTEDSSASSLQRPENKRRREVRLLDLNVQYYPCKICGSKFPSYYFVHKHKKLCHSATEILNAENEDNNSGNEAAGCSTQT
ncbi:zinc finger and BTB domain-containing protein 47 [Cotesia glomerata]|uniref:Uncharacterized protein n=1 Tax=Cotesia glomerata TaxID=32391 RepID=A0AAV7IV96_COTGL|nr:zinc finger and BTB domain-containing protein 47 [Cotesia glomerata]KAH0558002.1 hypothetical protein KQX54_013621 [Cotesia glomerata]